MWNASCCYSQHACYFLWGFFQFRITPKVKLYLRGVASCCHLNCKSSVTDFSGSAVLCEYGWISESEVILPRALGHHGLTRLSSPNTAMARHTLQDTARLPRLHPYPLLEPAYSWRWALAWCVCCLNLTLTISEQNQMFYKARGSMRPPKSISYLNFLLYSSLQDGAPAQSRDTQLCCLWRWHVHSDTEEKEISLCNVHTA